MTLDEIEELIKQRDEVANILKEFKLGGSLWNYESRHAHLLAMKEKGLIND